MSGNPRYPTLPSEQCADDGESFLACWPRRRGQRSSVAARQTPWSTSCSNTFYVPHELQRLINNLHIEYKSLTEGDVATYIPELGRANPEHFGVCVVTADGRVFEGGGCDHPLT